MRNASHRVTPNAEHVTFEAVLDSFRLGREYTLTDVQNRTGIACEIQVRDALDFLASDGTIKRGHINLGESREPVWRLING